MVKGMKGKMNSPMKFKGPDTTKDQMRPNAASNTPQFGKGDKRSMVKGPDLSGGGHIKK